MLCAVLGKLLLVDLPSWNLTGLFLYAGPYSWRDALLRLVDFGAVAGFCAAAYALTRRRKESEMWMLFAGSSVAVLFVYSTLELNSLLHFYLEGMRDGGISILWSLFALGFLLRGIVRHGTELRYLGLALFTVVVAKVFLVDLSVLDSFYRIIAFIVLGIVVLAGSLVYLKFRDSFTLQPADGDPELGRNLP